MKIETQTELQTFFSEWYQWATQPKVEDTRNFHRGNALCTSLHFWATWNKLDSVKLHAELVALLERDFKGNYQFPFDKNASNYWQAKGQQRFHKSKERLEWVKKQIGM